MRYTNFCIDSTSMVRKLTTSSTGIEYFDWLDGTSMSMAVEKDRFCLNTVGSSVTQQHNKITVRYLRITLIIAINTTKWLYLTLPQQWTQWKAWASSPQDSPKYLLDLEITLHHSMHEKSYVNDPVLFDCEWLAARNWWSEETKS